MTFYFVVCCTPAPPLPLSPQVLWLTKPDEWSPAGVLAATRIFASNFNERMAQRFFNIVLVGRVQVASAPLPPAFPRMDLAQTRLSSWRLRSGGPTDPPMILLD